MMKKKSHFCLKFKVSISFSLSLSLEFTLNSLDYIFFRVVFRWKEAIKSFQGYHFILWELEIFFTHKTLVIYQKIEDYLHLPIFISITSTSYYPNKTWMDEKSNFYNSLHQYKLRRVATLNIILRTYTIVRASLVIKIANKFLSHCI